MSRNASRAAINKALAAMRYAERTDVLDAIEAHLTDALAALPYEPLPHTARPPHPNTMAGR